MKQKHAQSRRPLLLGALGCLAFWLVGCGALVTAPPSLQATGSTAITQPYPTPSGATPLYQAPLTTPAAGWATGPECTFTNGGLIVTPNGGKAYMCLAPLAAVMDFSASVTVQQLSGLPTHAFGLAFRHASPMNYYFFGIDGRGRFTLTVVVNDVSHTVIAFTPNAAIHAGANATNTLEVVAHGQVVTVLVNGTAVGQATLSTFARGTIGLRGVNDGQVRFQQLVVYPG